MNRQPPPDRRDQLLSDLHEDPSSLSLPAQMAARIRRRRRIRIAFGSLAVLTIAGIALFHSRQHLPVQPQLAKTSSAVSHPSSIAAARLPKANIATDADLMAALEQESVMVFTLADGQHQIVWLSGSPKI
ncbi:MAG: hypothetical protein QM760_23010 [Nibricoccus sp.]